MQNKKEMLQKYAKLVATTGINVQKGQTVVLRSSVENAEFARLVTEECWLAGAGNVVTLYSDIQCDRLKYQHGDQERISKVLPWQLDQLIDYPNGEACYISIVGDDPDALKGLDPTKIGTVMNARMHAMVPYREMMQKNENQWCIVAASTAAWATKIFTDIDSEKAVEKLWQAIFTCMRLDQPDPVKAWQVHSDNLEKYSNFLNNSGIEYLHFKNSIGTDLTIKLVKNYVWCGGASKRHDNTAYQANMPTEEVFTMPDNKNINGTVVSSLPLNYQGNMIEDFSFTFKDGVVINHTAKKGLEALTLMLDADPASKSLGEVALVPFSSPIRQSGVLFLNTLFDENASCHLALGNAYPENCSDWAELTEEQRQQRGINKSVIHVDFMFGTADMSVVGTKKDGSTINVFTNGEWSI